MTIAETIKESTPRKIAIHGLSRFLVSMVFITSFFVKFEPAPTDIFLLLALIASIFGGLRLPVAIMPLFLFLLIYNLSGLFSFILISEDTQYAVQYLIGLAETSISGVFLAAYVCADPVNRFHQIIKAYWVGATIGATLGLCSYFKIEPIYTWLPDFAGRALGGYKDPNVFSTWLVFPFVTMLQGFILGNLRIRPLSVISFTLIFMGLFLAFSRGAWINSLIASLIMIVLTFTLSPSRGVKNRMVFSTIIGISVLAIAIAVLLSIPETRTLFLDRFTLVKSYDAGETGRFGNQLNSIPILQTLPFGLGPYQFAFIFGLAPHNTFLNSFSSAGWIGGTSYMMLVLSHFIVGFKTITVRTQFQPFAIVTYSCMIAVILQGVQIDTEHWRHLYWMTGILWGFFAASFAYLENPPTLAEIAQSWNLPQSRRAD
jgi:hypothetical protein